MQLARRRRFAKTSATVRTGAAVTGSRPARTKPRLVEGGVRGGLWVRVRRLLRVRRFELHLPRHHRHISGLRGQNSPPWTSASPRPRPKRRASCSRRNSGVRRRLARCGAEAGVPPACTSGRDCEAHCFLSQVADVCAPQLGELSNFVACSGQLPSLGPEAPRHGRPKKSIDLMSAKPAARSSFRETLSNQGAQPCLLY